MGNNLVLEVFILHIEFIDHVFLLEDLQEFFAIIQLVEVFNPVINICLKSLELIQCLIGKILWRWPIVLHRLKVTDNFFGV